MEIRYYLSIFWRRKWVIVVTTIVVLAVTVIGQTFMTPIYTATTTLRVAASLGLSQNFQFYTYNTQLMNTYVELVSSRPVLEELTKRLQVDQAPKIAAEVVSNTELIRITASSPDPKMAALASNTLAQILIEQSDQLYAGGAEPSTQFLLGQLEQAQADFNQTVKEYQRLIVQTPPAPNITLTNQILQQKQQTYATLLRQYQQAQYLEDMQSNMITIVEEAVPPVSPSQPRKTLNGVLALILGLFSGTFLAFVLENIDAQLHSTQEIEENIHAPALAKLPKSSKDHLYISQNGISPLAESVRYLASQIQLAGQKPSHKVFIFTGAEPGQGVTMTVANLGSALAEQGRHVLLVDGNIRDPQLHDLFELQNEQGLTDVLSGRLDVSTAIQKIDNEFLSLLSTGPVIDFAPQAFGAAGTESLIKSLRQRFDYVLIDTPALTVADIVGIAPFADELILVARRSHVRREAIQFAWEYLSKFRDKTVGLIVNEAESTGVFSLA